MFSKSVWNILQLNLLLLLFVKNIAGQYDPNFLPGKTTMVHLFEWKWNDIALECERFLGPMGYAGVQVSPPNENVIFNSGVVKRPWYERYQPVSYKLETRSGTEEEFKQMVRRCSNVGVRIYVDAVINHMTGSWPAGTPATANSTFNTEKLTYDAVPYSASDFHNSLACPTMSGNIENYGIAQQVRNCRLTGLLDLDHSQPNVQNRILEFLNRLVDYGVAGFRLDASKHMWPTEINAITSKVKDLSTDFGFAPGSRPFIYQEVIDLGGEAITANDYTGNGRVTEFKYGAFLGRVFRNANPARWLRNFGEQWGMLKNTNALVFVDNHDNQRGHGAGGSSILTFRESKIYKIANAFMLSWPYGVTRVMSSYFWDKHMVNGEDENNWVGPPHDADYNTLSVKVNPDLTCSDGWICEHRWRQIYNMVKFRNIVQDANVTNWWDNQNYQIAYCRNGKGFIAINADDYPLNTMLQTCLPQGTYCDVISGNESNGTCTGKSITVGPDGKAAINISNNDEDPIVAIHIQDKL